MPIRLGWLLALGGLAGGSVHAQRMVEAGHSRWAVAAPFKEEAVANAAAPCVQPAPMVRIEDYDGPLKKVVGTFARPLERKSVHPPHYKPGDRLCTLALKDKFFFFVQDSFDPVNLLSTAFAAGIDQAENNDPSYGQGTQGYAKRWGAEYGGGVISRFFKDFAYPTIFSEDPRYYRLAHGSGGKRLLHAVQHALVAHHDDGTRMFNFSEWLGTTSAVVLTNTYHPDARRGVANTAERVGLSVLQDTGFDALREFWPEISRKFKLPFRGETESTLPLPGSSATAR